MQHSHRIALGAAVALLGVALAAIGGGPRGSAPVAAAPVEAWSLSAVWETDAAAVGPDAFYQPRGLAFELDPFTDQASVYIVDSGNQRVQVFDVDGAYLRSIGPIDAAEAGGLAGPRDVALQGDLLLVTDPGHDRVAVFSSQGQYAGQWPELPGAWGIAASPDGRIAVVDNETSQVHIHRADGQRQATWGGFGEGAGQLNRPRGAAFTADGRLVVADRGNQRLVVFDRQGRSIEEAPLAELPEDVEVDWQGGDILVGHADGSIRRYRDEISLPERSGSALALAGVAGLTLGRDAAGVSHLLASFVDTNRPLHGVRHWIGNPPRDPAMNAEWGDFELPLGRIDAPFRIAGQGDGARLADRWPRVQRFDAAGQALDQHGVGRLDDLAPAADGGLWVVADDRATRYAADGSPAGSSQLDPPAGGYSWLVAAAARPEGVFALDVGGQRLVRLTGTGQIDPIWRFGSPGAAPIALWDLAPAPDGWFLINRSSDSLELREPVSGTLRAAWSVPGRPLRVTSDEAGRAYVLNGHGWVLVYTADGQLMAAWDASLGEAGSRPADLTVDAAGRLLVADAGLDRVAVFTPDPEGDPGDLPDFEPACAAEGDKWADPTRLILGQETTIRLRVGGRCPDILPESDVILVIDHSGSMIGEKMEAAQEAAIAFTAAMDFSRDRVAVVGFNQEALLLAPLSSDASLVEEAIEGLVAGGGTDIAAGVDAARFELTGPRRRLSANSVIVLLTDGGSAVPAALRAADQSRLEGARLFTIGFGAGANEALLRQMASAPEDYYFASAARDLTEVYRAIAARITAEVLFGNLTVRDELPRNMAFVAGSGAPEPEVQGQLLTWRLAEVPLSGIELRYRVRPLETGRHPTNVLAVGEGTDGLGRRGRVDFPVPEVEVVAPTATPTPSQTPSPSPTPSITPTTGPTVVPRPIYLPLLQRRGCLLEQHLDVVLILDTSSSMLDLASGGRSKLELAIEAAAGFVELLDLAGGDAVALVHFNTDAAIDLPLSGDAAAVQRALRSLPQAAGTRIDLGLERAVDALSPDDRDPEKLAAAILLTDGRPSGTTEAEVLAAAGRLRQVAALTYAIGLGQDVDARLLASVAGDPSRRILAPEAEDLARIYAELARQLPCGGP